MESFSIYKKSTKFYWSNNRVIYTIIISCFLLFYLNIGNGIIEKKLKDKILSIILLLFYVCGFILKLIGFPRFKPLIGKIEGHITFDFNSIQIENEIFFLDQIKSIEINNNDYYGEEEKRFSFLDFNGKKSNGVNNNITIRLISGKLKTCNYELCTPDDFQKIKNELINYYRFEKISFKNLAEALDKESRKEVNELKDEIERICGNNENR